MVGPLVPARVKQRDHVASARVDPGKIRSLAEIASLAGEGQIVSFVTPSVLPGNDVFDVVAKLRAVLGKEAVLAPVLRPLPHRLANERIHATGGWTKEGGEPSVSKWQ